MAFEGLSEKLNATFKRLRGKGRLSESDVREAMREVRLALLEADVSYKVVKEFVATVTEKAIGGDVLDSLTPAQQVINLGTALLDSQPRYLGVATRAQTMIEPSAQLHKFNIAAFAPQAFIQRHDAEPHIFSAGTAETLQDAGTGTAEPNDDDSFFFTGSGLIGKHGSMLVWKRVE